MITDDGALPDSPFATFDVRVATADDAAALAPLLQQLGTRDPLPDTALLALALSDQQPSRVTLIAERDEGRIDDEAVRAAVRAGVPIVPFILDFGRKELRITPVFHPTGDMEADMKALISRYQGVVPADPSRLSGPLREPGNAG